MLVQFKRSFKRNDKPICQALCLFIAHLVNQQVADDILAFEIAIFLLDKPSGMSADASEQLQRRTSACSWLLEASYLTHSLKCGEVAVRTLDYGIKPADDIDLSELLPG